jgi:hypothetical protein
MKLAVIVIIIFSVIVILSVEKQTLGASCQPPALELSTICI